jgi:hypothetical protein
MRCACVRERTEDLHERVARQTVPVVKRHARQRSHTTQRLETTDLVHEVVAMEVMLKEALEELDGSG